MLLEDLDRACGALGRLGETSLPHTENGDFRGCKWGGTETAKYFHGLRSFMVAPGVFPCVGGLKLQACSCASYLSAYGANPRLLVKLPEAERGDALDQAAKIVGISPAMIDRANVVAVVCRDQ